MQEAGREVDPAWWPNRAFSMLAPLIMSIGSIESPFGDSANVLEVGSAESTLAAWEGCSEMGPMPLPFGNAKLELIEPLLHYFYVNDVLGVQDCVLSYK